MGCLRVGWELVPDHDANVAGARHGTRRCIGEIRQRPSERELLWCRAAVAGGRKRSGGAAARSTGGRVRQAPAGLRGAHEDTEPADRHYAATWRRTADQLAASTSSVTIPREIAIETGCTVLMSPWG